VDFSVGDGEVSTSPPVSLETASGFRRRHRSAVSSVGFTGVIDHTYPHGLLDIGGGSGGGGGSFSNRTPEDFQTKLRSRHKSSVDDRRWITDMDDSSRDLLGALSFHSFISLGRLMIAANRLFIL